jgi:hypothetical protein
MWIDDIEFSRSGTLVRTLTVAPECHDRFGDPMQWVRRLRAGGSAADLLVCGQRIPDTRPRAGLQCDWESLAALKITTYEDWLIQRSKDTRKNIQRASKRGVIVRECRYDDAFVAGIKSIYDESATRQGKPFWHYGKDLETVRRENGTYMSESVLLGAFVGDEMVGFLKYFVSGRCASTLQVISKLAHRDKKTNNALIAKAVECCAAQGIEYLQYGVWSEGSLGEFKISNGFTRFEMPRYTIALTWRGRAALALKLHRNWRDHLPAAWVQPLRAARRAWYERGA